MGSLKIKLSVKQHRTAHLLVLFPQLSGSCNLLTVVGLLWSCSGIGAGSLPIGAQLIGDRLSERLLYRCGYALEQALNITFDKEDKSR